VAFNTSVTLVTLVPWTAMAAERACNYTAYDVCPSTCTGGGVSLHQRAPAIEAPCPQPAEAGGDHGIDHNQIVTDISLRFYILAIPLSPPAACQPLSACWGPTATH
jgi:hypothetical protein